jgi:hypothetical protein
MGGNAIAPLDDLVGRGAQCTAADHHAARSVGTAPLHFPIRRAPAGSMTSAVPCAH